MPELGRSWYKSQRTAVKIKHMEHLSRMAQRELSRVTGQADPLWGTNPRNLQLQIRGWPPRTLLMSYTGEDRR